jgi:hypothetical protein
MNEVRIIAIAGGFLTLAALACAPLYLSWAARLRWTVAAQCFDLAFGVGTTTPLDLRQVTLVQLDPRPDGALLRVVEIGRSEMESQSYELPAPLTPQLELTLQEWCSLRTPMLLYVRRDGVATLAGPSTGVGNLHPATAPVA